MHDFASRSQSKCFSQPNTGTVASWIGAQPVQSPLSPLATQMPLAYAPLPGRSMDIAIDDWNELFRAVEARLIATVGTPLATASGENPGDIGPRVQGVVLECVTAMDQLHTALTRERNMRHQLEMEVFDAQTALARALAENAGTQPLEIQLCDHQLPAQSLTQGVDVAIGSMPSSQGFAAMLQAYRTSGGTLRGDDLSRVLEHRKTGDHVSLAKLMASREVFSFEWNYKCWVPMFQFEPCDLHVRSGPRQVVGELVTVLQGWALAAWFVQPNAWLNGRLPVNLMESDLPDVLAAARSDRFVAAG